MNKIKNPVTMLIAGTLACGLCGFIFFWLRAGLFGLALTLTVLLVQRKGWSWITFLPGITLGIGLGFFPVRFPDFGIGDPNIPPAYDYLTLINCALFMPIYVYAYLKPKWWSRIWRMLLAGGLSCVFRSISLNAHHWHFHITDSYVFGILPFVLLWLLAMRFTDPRFTRDNLEIQQAGLS